MNKKIVPFVINSNICTSKKDVETYDVLMDAIAGNSGNSYITWSLLKEIGCDLESIKGHEIKSLYTYDFNNTEKDIDIINNECTNVILVLQDQIRIEESYGYRLPYVKIKKFISQINKPILIAGLGANSFNGFDSNFYKKLDAELVDFLHYLSDCCEIIGLRGYFTQEVLYKLGIKNTCVIGCPSYYETGKGRVLNKPIYSNTLRVGTSIGVHTYGVGPVYLQDKLEENIIKALCFNGELKLSYKELCLLQKRMYRFHTSIIEWKRDLASNIDFYVGTRVHGSMVAMNSGVPTVVMNKDSRAREMCEYMNIPYHPELFGCRNVEKILSVCDYDKMNQHYNEKFDIFVEFLKNNNIQYNPLEHSQIEPEVTNKLVKIDKHIFVEAYAKFILQRSKHLSRVLFGFK